MGEIRTLSQLLNALEHGYRVTGRDVTSEQSQDAAHNSKKDDERHFCLSIAGHVIEINTIHTEAYSLCRGYLCEGNPDITVNVYEEDLSFERIEAKKAKTPQKDSYLETLAVYRKICTALLDYDIFLMHGAAIAEKDSAYLFTAKSGTGKTTHIRKWLDNLEDAYVVNGDKPLIHITEKEAVICGTPWCGKENLNTKCMTPLKAVILMERGENNMIREISFGDAFTGLLQQTYQPEDKDKLKKTLKLVSQLKGKVSFYHFIFNNMKEDAFSVAYEALTNRR